MRLSFFDFAHWVLYAAILLIHSKKYFLCVCFEFTSSKCSVCIGVTMTQRADAALTCLGLEVAYKTEKKRTLSATKILSIDHPQPHPMKLRPKG